MTSACSARKSRETNKGIYNPQPPCLFIRPSTIGFPRHSCPLRTLRFRWPARAGARRHRRRPARACSHSSPRVTGPRTSSNSQRRRNSSESNSSSSSSFCPPTYGGFAPRSLTHTRPGYVLPSFIAYYTTRAIVALFGGNKTRRVARAARGHGMACGPSSAIR